MVKIWGVLLDSLGSGILVGKRYFGRSSKILIWTIVRG